MAVIVDIQLKLYVWFTFSIFTTLGDKKPPTALLNITGEFYESPEVKVEQAFYLSINQTALTKSLKLNVKLPSNVNHVILISNSIVTTKKLTLPTCYPLRMGVLKTETPNGDIIFKDAFECNFKSKGSEVKSKLIDVQPDDKFFVSYFEDQPCNRSSSVVRITGILAYSSNIDGNCPVSRIKLYLGCHKDGNKAICIKNFKNTIMKDGLKAVGAIIIESEEIGYTMNVKIIFGILVPALLILLLAILIFCQIKKNRLKKREKNDQPDCETKKLLPVQQFYSLSDQNPRGLCLIIANNEFSKASCLPAKRTSVESDLNLIQNSFNELRFELIIQRNQTVEEMKNLLKSLEFQPHYDSLFIFILSHGSKGEIYGREGNSVETHELVEQLDHCENLKEKPKFIFVIGNSKNHIKVNKAVTYPNTEDMLVAYATTAQLPSIKSGQEPTFFLRTLCHLLKEKPNENIRKLVRAACDETSEIIKDIEDVDLKPVYNPKLAKVFKLQNQDEEDKPTFGE